MIWEQPQGGRTPWPNRCCLGKRRRVRAAAMSLPATDRSFDAVVSGLALNFVPDPARVSCRDGLGHRRRCAVGAYVWDYGGDAADAVLLGRGGRSRSGDPGVRRRRQGSSSPEPDPFRGLSAAPGCPTSRPGRLLDAVSRGRLSRPAMPCRSTSAGALPRNASAWPFRPRTTGLSPWRRGLGGVAVVSRSSLHERPHLTRPSRKPAKPGPPRQSVCRWSVLRLVTPPSRTVWRCAAATWWMSMDTSVGQAAMCLAGSRGCTRRCVATSRPSKDL
jgi:hypothetical protein